MKSGRWSVAFIIGLAGCSPSNPYPKTFDIQVGGNIRHVVFDAAHGSATTSQRNCVKRMRVYAINDAPVAPSSGDNREAVRIGLRWEAEAVQDGQCLGGLPREYGDSGLGNVRVSPKPLRVGSSYGIAIKLDGGVLGSTRFQVLPDGSLRPISLEESMRFPHPQ